MAAKPMPVCDPKSPRFSPSSTQCWGPVVAEVSITIGGHSYVLSTGEGEEDALHRLAAIVDQRVASARAMAGGLSEVRQLLIASLLLADELSENGAPSSPAPSENEASARIEAATQRIAALSQRLDALAARTA